MKDFPEVDEQAAERARRNHEAELERDAHEWTQRDRLADMCSVPVAALDGLTAEQIEALLDPRILSFCEYERQVDYLAHLLDTV